MIRYKLNDNFDGTEAIVSLDARDPNEYAEIEYSGDKELTDTVRSWLSSAAGAFGHLIGERTTAIDLDAALKGTEAERFNPQLIEGEQLVAIYDPQTPNTAVL